MNRFGAILTDQAKLGKKLYQGDDPVGQGSD
jgi:hypothetical protein